MSALSRAIEAFKRDRDARVDGLEARRDLAKRIAEAHASGISDQQLANAFKRVEQDRKLLLSRARIQQLRTKDAE